MQARKWTEEAIIAKLQEIESEVGYVSCSENAHSGLRGAIIDKFGSWAEACKAAGVKSGRDHVRDYAGKRVFEPKRDCLFYISDTMCYGLKAVYCKTEGECNFYKEKVEGDELFEPVAKRG